MVQNAHNTLLLTLSRSQGKVRMEHFRRSTLHLMLNMFFLIILTILLHQGHCVQAALVWTGTILSLLLVQKHLHAAQCFLLASLVESMGRKKWLKGRTIFCPCVEFTMSKKTYGTVFCEVLFHIYLDILKRGYGIEPYVPKTVGTQEKANEVNKKSSSAQVHLLMGIPTWNNLPFAGQLYFLKKCRDN